jgi:polyisoprenoid-binding protein YceI
MKKTFLFGFLALGFLAACEQAPKSDEAQVGEAQEVTASTEAQSVALDTESSSVTWVGTKPTGKHNGTLKISEGNILIKDNAVTGGSFVIDMASLVVLDIPAEDENNGKLAGHLKSGDFFEVEKFPTAKFEIVKVEPYTAAADTEEKDPEYTLANPTHTVTGNLELKGVTKSITFPAVVSVNNGKVQAEAKFNINRKDWNISYGADESLGDKFIRPTVHIGFNVSSK